MDVLGMILGPIIGGISSAFSDDTPKNQQPPPRKSPFAYQPLQGGNAYMQNLPPINTMDDDDKTVQQLKQAFKTPTMWG